MLSSSNGHGAALLALHAASRAHLDEFMRQQGDELDKILALEADLAVWLEILESRPEVSQYRSAHRDLGLSLYAISSGLHRQAFAGLRSFIEVAFGALHLSASELERRKWVSGRRDLSWGEITSPDEGLYAVPYLREFMPTAIDESPIMAADLKAAYRRCSEYLHGNVATSELLPSQISYASGPIGEWRIAAERALGTLHRSLFIRYYADLGVSSGQMLEPLLEQHLGHLLSIRRALGLPIEEA